MINTPKKPLNIAFNAGFDHEEWGFKDGFNMIQPALTNESWRVRLKLG